MTIRSRLVQSRKTHLILTDGQSILGKQELTLPEGDTTTQGNISWIPDHTGNSLLYLRLLAVRYARLARAAGVSDCVKLEVIGDEQTLFPDTAGLIEAAKILIKEGFIVLPYTNDDPVVAKKLVDIGCPAVMPLAAPIGSGLGIRNPYNLKIILESVKVPVIVDAGVGTASDAALAMEYGADAVMMNTAIAGAQDPIMMAEAMKRGVEEGRLAYRAGRIPRKLYATASSPIEGML